MIAYHFVFCGKYRRPIFAEPKIKATFEALVRSICTMRGWEIIAFETMSDHTHLLLSVKLTDSPAKIANAVKGITSREIRKRYPAIKRTITDHLWSGHYYCEGIGSTGKKDVKRYIENQEVNWIKARAKA